MKPYPKYKSSGIEWVGEIPDKWGFSKIKFSSYVKGRIGWQGLRTDEYCDEGTYLVTGTDFVDGRIKWADCHHVSKDRYDQDPYIQLRNQDLLITKDGTIGKVALVEQLPDIATLNTGILVVRPENSVYLTPYMFWILNSALLREFIEYTKAGSTISHLYQETFGEFAFPVPKISEQQSIATYLDRKTKQIDGLIEKKQNQIDLLREQRIAVINEAVTKGLNPKAKMKDSGIEWIGEIPAHWEMPRLKFVARLQGGYAFSTDAFQNEGVPVVRMNNLRRGTLDLSESIRVDDDHAEAEYALEEGNLLLGMSGSIGETGSLGNYAIVKKSDLPCQLNQRVGRFRRGENCLSNYLCYFVQSKPFTLPLLFDCTGTAQFNISSGQVGEIVAPLPPASEQQDIASFLDHKTSEFDTMIAKEERLIELLQEYRTSLISEVVTGKVDVRDVRSEN